jgi:hypothetical protein
MTRKISSLFVFCFVFLFSVSVMAETWQTFKSSSNSFYADAGLVFEIKYQESQIVEEEFSDDILNQRFLDPNKSFDTPAYLYVLNTMDFQDFRKSDGTYDNEIIDTVFELIVSEVQNLVKSDRNSFNGFPTQSYLYYETLDVPGNNLQILNYMRQIIVGKNLFTLLCSYMKPESFGSLDANSSEYREIERNACLPYFESLKIISYK